MQPSRADSGLRVLIADDEATIRTVLRRLLNRRGHEIDEAEDAEGALALIRDRRYDALLIDVNMPGNGGRVMDTLLSQDLSGRVILMTGDPADPVALEGSERVFRVQKPFDFDALIHLVEGGTESPS